MAKVQFAGNQRTAPAWMADWAGREHLEVFPAKLVASAFNSTNGVQVVATGIAAIDATTVAVTALAYPAIASTVLIAAGNVLIPAGTTLRFGTKKFVTLTADAIVGATSLTVEALPTALAVGDTAYYSRYGDRLIPSGTLVGRTFAERDANTGFGPADLDLDNEVYLTAFDVPDVLDNNDVELYRPTARVYENYLPNYSLLTTAANEVQLVTFDAIMTAGVLGITANDYQGIPRTVKVAFNTSWTQTVADIQTALIALLGTAAVAAAVTNTKDMTLTFSGTNYASIAQPYVGVDISGATGPTKATVTRPTASGAAWINKIRKIYQCQKAAQ